MQNHHSEIINFFNELSLSNFEDIAIKNCEDISSRLKQLNEIFEKHIEELKGLSVGNKTRTKLLNSTDDVEFILKGIVNESSLNGQTEYINYWIARLMLCRRTILLLIPYLKKKCCDFKLHWKERTEKDTSNVKNTAYLFRSIYDIYGQIYGLCQNVGIAIYDYFDLYGKIKSNIIIKEKDFRLPYFQDPEVQVSERISQINREAENCLIANPPRSILGFSAVRIALESFI